MYWDFYAPELFFSKKLKNFFFKKILIYIMIFVLLIKLTGSR